MISAKLRRRLKRLNEIARWREKRVRANMEIATSVDRRAESNAMKGPSGEGSPLIKTERGWKLIES